jgi:hypothetical protein
MGMYKITYHETAYYDDIMIEADSKEEAEAIFFDKWDNDREFGLDVLLNHPVTVTNAFLDIRDA